MAWSPKTAQIDPCLALNMYINQILITTLTTILNQQVKTNTINRTINFCIIKTNHRNMNVKYAELTEKI